MYALDILERELGERELGEREGEEKEEAERSLQRGGLVEWKSLERAGTEEQEKYKAVSARDKAKTDRIRTEVDKRGAASERPRTAQGAKVCSTQH